MTFEFHFDTHNVNIAKALHSDLDDCARVPESAKDAVLRQDNRSDDAEPSSRRLSTTGDLLDQRHPFRSIALCLKEARTGAASPPTNSLEHDAESQLVST